MKLKQMRYILLAALLAPAILSGCRVFPELKDHLWTQNPPFRYAARYAIEPAPQNLSVQLQIHGLCFRDKCDMLLLID